MSRRELFRYRTTRITALVLAGLVGALITIGDSAAQAQNPRTRFEPSRPRFSPYMEYFRRDTGLMDNYNTFIVPRQRLNYTFQQQQTQLRQLQGELNQLEQAAQAVETQATPTGKGAGFMNYLHYYPAPRAGARR